MNDKNSLYKGVLTANAAIGEMILLGNLMDMVKIEKQRNYQKSYFKIIKDFTRPSFTRGLLVGFWPWGFLMYGSRGLFYGTTFNYTYGKISYFNYNYQLNLTESRKKILSGMNAGLIEGSITAPFALMRTRLSQNISNKTEFKWRDQINQISRGIPINALKRSCDWGLRSLINEEFKKNNVDPFTSGFLSGVVSCTITTPIDRLLPIIQQNNPPKNIKKWFLDNIREKGLRAFFAGNFARILHGGWHTLFVFSCLHLFEDKKPCQY